MSNGRGGSGIFDEAALLLVGVTLARTVVLVVDDVVAPLTVFPLPLRGTSGGFWMPMALR